jgi:NADH dehydrogenase (ubiquinone) 1 beta subcomplex subunit 7
MSDQQPVMKCTAEQMARHRIPLAYRDYCAHLLIRLNKCREHETYMPWKCEHERHSYEVCEYKEFKRRQALFTEQQEAAAAAKQ